MKPVARKTAYSLVLASTIAWGQAGDEFVDSIQIEVTPMASAAIRAASVDWNIDLDDDQFVTREEIELARDEAQENFARAARLGGMGGPYGTRGAAFGVGRSNTYRGFGGNNFSGFSSYSRGRVATNSVRMSRASDRLREVTAAYRDFNFAEADEISLANADFRTRYSHLDGAQRTMLLKADARGNNNGSLSALEFIEFEEGWLFFKGKFEREFGKQALDGVMDILLETSDIPALDNVTLVD